MAVVFVLGPSEWREAGLGPSPMDFRRRLAQTFSDHGHYPIVMEDVPDEQTDTDLMWKFDRILDTMGVTDIVVYYPQGARMQTTFDEFILLAKR